MLVRPGAEQFAVTLNQRVTLELRKLYAVFVALGVPHAKHGVGVGTPEAVDDLRVLSKMTVQRCPVGSERFLHGTNTPADFCARCAVLGSEVRLVNTGNH